jgi:hypothetical protein
MGAIVRVAIIGDSRGLHGSTTSAEHDLDSLGKSGVGNSKKLTDSFAKVAKAAALGAAAIVVLAAGYGVVAVKAGDKLNEKTGNLNNTLKNTHQNVVAADKAVRDAVPSFEKFGITQLQLTEGVNKYVLAGESYTQAIKDERAATDLAASANVDLGTAENALLMIHAGKYRMAAKLLGITKEQLAGWSKEEIATGKITAAQKKLLVPMTELQVKELLLSRTHGAAAEKAKSLGGQIEHLKAWFADLTAHLGQKLIPIVEEVGAWFGQFLPPLIAAVGGWLEHVINDIKAHWPQIMVIVDAVGQKFTTLGLGIAHLAEWAWPKIQTAFEWFITHKAVMQATAVGVGAALFTLFTIWAVNAAIAAAATIVAAAPLLLLVGAVAILAAGAFLLWTKWNTIWNWIKDHKAYAAILVAVFPIIGVVLGLVAAAKYVADHWSGIWDGIVSVTQAIGRGVQGVFNDIVNGIIDGLNQLIRAYDDTAGRLPGFHHIKPLGAFAPAQGAPTTSSTGSGRVQGFSAGGMVPGVMGKPQLATVHGGERVLTPAQQRQGSGSTHIYNFPAGIDPAAVVRAQQIYDRRNGIT